MASASSASSAAVDAPDGRLSHHSMPVKEVLASMPTIPAIPEDSDLVEFETKGRELWERVGRPRYVAAPMVAGSDLAFRMQVRRHGVQLAYSPMLNANIMSKSGCFNGYTCKSLTTTCDARDRPLFVQIAGKTPEIVAEAGRRLEEDLGEHIDGVDLNFGCPQNCAKRAGYGAFALEDADQAIRVVQSLSSCIKVPVTCKIRLLPRMEDTILLARRMVAAGCQVLAVHGRTRLEKGPATANADWDSIAAIRRAVKVPVIANGGTPSRFEAETCLRVTGADAVMVSEALLEDPAFFARPFSPVEQKLLPPAGFWKCLDPQPWDHSRQLHLALAKHYRCVWADTSRAAAAASASAASAASKKASGVDAASAEPDTRTEEASPDAAPVWAKCLGMREPDADTKTTSLKYLSSVPVAPRAGVDGPGAGVDAIELAEEYLSICEEHGCQIKELRVHLFRILCGLLHTHPDLRRSMDAGTPELKRLFRRESATTERASRRHRSAAGAFLLSHLPHGTGTASPPPLVKAQIFLMRSILAKLRARVRAGWPRVVVREPHDPAAAASTSEGAASGSTASSSEYGLSEIFSPLAAVASAPDEPLQPASLGATVREATTILTKEQSGSPWILQRPHPTLPTPVVELRNEPVPWFGASSSSASASSSSASSSSASASSSSASSSSASAPEEPLADARPAIDDIWPDVDVAAASAFFRKWPPTSCKDLQRKPGIPAGLDTVRPGLWYFRHVLEPLESRTLSSITVPPTVRALLAEKDNQPNEAGVPADIQASMATFIAQLPVLPLPESLVLKPHVHPPGKRSLARRLKKQQLLEQAQAAAAAPDGTAEEATLDTAAKRVKHADPATE